jgi:Transglutaminase-like superfamily
MKFLYVLIFLICFTQCSPKTDNKWLEYAANIAVAGQPSAEIQQIAKKHEIYPKNWRIAYYYKEIRGKWKDRTDALDKVETSKNTLQKANLEGDCEDLAALLWAYCRVNKIPAVVVLGDDKHKGHAWLEVLVVFNYKKKPDEVSRELRYFDTKTSTLIEHNENLWVALNPTHAILPFKNCYYIDTVGVLYEQPYKIIDKLN